MAARRSTLTDQLIGRQVILLAALLFVVGVAQYLILRTVLFQSTARSLHDEISVLAPLIHHTISSRGLLGFSHIANILVNRLRGPGVEVVITNALGHVMASSSTLHAMVPPLYATPYFIWNGRVVVDAVLGNPYYPSGYVWLMTSVAPIHGILRRDAELYVFLASISLILAGWLGSFSVRHVMGPLEKIRDSTRKIAAGEFGHVTEFHDAPQEIEELTQAINVMSLAIRDLFEQEKALSERMRQFVADASHELRTPLTAINGFLDLMYKSELTPDEQQKALAAIRAQSQRMARLVSQLLTLSRADTAPDALVHPVPLALDRWLPELEATWRALVAPRPLTLDITSVSIWADPDRMTEVFFNLLDNIARYTPPDTPVSIVTRHEPPWVLILIEDSGPGIAPEDLPHIFDRFYRGDRARSSSSGGSGLGLSIVKALVEAQDGQIAVETLPPPHTGTRFYIRLREAPGPEATAPDTRPD